jgi:hypothetical protein
MKTNLPIPAIVERLGREEQTLKRAGAFAEAAGIRDAIVQILRMADEDEAPIDSSDEDTP